MSLGVTKECFPDPTECHNCLRKRSSDVKKKMVQTKDYKRCSNCHLMTYCDKNCQREHWLKIHKKYCEVLSGKTLFSSPKHNAASCDRCTDEEKSSKTQISSVKSPKTVCNIDEVTMALKTQISALFGFHREGKKCNCTLQYAVELPFPLGEVTGQYMEIGSTGLDAMLANALNILIAMSVKGKKTDNCKNALKQLWTSLIYERSSLWCDILVRGMSSVGNVEYVLDQVTNLQTMYGASDPWWKSLKFSVDFVVETNRNLYSTFIISDSLDDPRFQIVKQANDYQKSQLQNQAIMCEKERWAKFMMWPALVNGSLVMVLPPGTRCQNCHSELRGEVAISPQELKGKHLPIMVCIGDNGTLMASCAPAKNKRCMAKCMSKAVMFQMKLNKDKWQQFQKEKDLFSIESRDCDFCLKSSLSSHRCSACLTVQYCSTVCQNKDLDFHKTVCSTWAKDKSRRIPGRGKQKDHWRSALGQK